MVTVTYKSSGASGKYKTYARGEAGTKSGTGGGTPNTETSYSTVRNLGGAKQIIVKKEESSSYPTVEVERKRLIQQAETLTTSQEAYLKKGENQAQKSAVQNTSEVDKLNQTFKNAGIGNAEEFFKAYRSGELKFNTGGGISINKKVEPTPAPIQETGSVTYYRDGKGGTTTKLTPRAEKVVNSIYSFEKRDKAMQTRQDDFQKRLTGLNPYSKALINTGYGLSVGFGEALASTTEKAFIFTGALTSKQLRRGAVNELKSASKELPSQLGKAYNPTTAQGQVNIALTVFGAYSLGKSITNRRALSKLKVKGEPTPDLKTVNKFNVKDTQFKDISVKVKPRAYDTSYKNQYGEVITMEGGKAVKTGQKVLTQVTKVTQPSPNKKIGIIESVGKGKVSSKGFLVDNQQVLLQSVKGKGLYNYERIIGYGSKGSGVAQYFKVNKVTGKAKYIGSLKVKSNTRVSLLEGKSKTTYSETEGGETAFKTSVKSSQQSGLGTTKKNLDFQSRTSETQVTTVKPQISTRSPFKSVLRQRSGSIVSETVKGGKVDLTPLKSDFKIVKGTAQQPTGTNEFILNAKTGALETVKATRPTVALVESKGTYVQQSTISFKGTPEAPAGSTRYPSITIKGNRISALPSTTKSKPAFIPIDNFPSSTTNKPSLVSIYRTVQIQSPAVVTKAPTTNIFLQTGSKPIITTKPTTFNVQVTKPDTFTDIKISDNKKSGSSSEGESETIVFNFKDLTPDYNIKEEPVIKPKKDDDIKPAFFSNSGSGSKGRSSNIFAPAVTPDFTSITKPKIDTTTRTETIQTTINKSITTTRRISFDFQQNKTPKPPIITPLFFPIKDEGQNVFSGFNVFVKSKGTFKQINKNPLSKLSAIKFGASMVENTASASFFVKPIKTSKKPQEIAGLFNANNFYSKGSLFIEKPSKRINTFGELKEITSKGIYSNRNSTKLRNAFGKNKGLKKLYGV